MLKFFFTARYSFYELIAILFIAKLAVTVSPWFLLLVIPGGIVQLIANNIIAEQDDLSH
jgi:hypothetical protein